jgi:hypothetical protein
MLLSRIRRMAVSGYRFGSAPPSAKSPPKRSGSQKATEQNPLAPFFGHFRTRGLRRSAQKRKSAESLVISLDAYPARFISILAQSQTACISGSIPSAGRLGDPKESAVKLNGNAKQLNLETRAEA